MPDNTIGWGQGAANNTNGWGAAASNNNLNWGYIHSRSYGHDETNLVGPENFFSLFGTPDFAYSLYDLSGGNPDALTERRSSDNAEQDFNSSEISAGDLVSFVGGGTDGTAVSLLDITGNGIDANQSFATNQPLNVNAGALITAGGIATTRFNGIDSFLKTASFISIPQPYTIFGVINPNVASFICDGGSTFQNAIRNNTSGQLSLRNGSQTISKTFTQGDLIAFWALSDGANSKIDVNNDGVVSGTLGTNSLDGFTVGRAGSSGLYGELDLGCLMVYGSDKSLEASSMITELQTIWGI